MKLDDAMVDDDDKSSPPQPSKGVPEDWVKAQTRAGVVYYTLIIPEREPSIRFDLFRLFGLRSRA